MSIDVDAEVNLVREHVERIAGGRGWVSFGELFTDPVAEQTFESLVGSLRAAKKRGVVKFDGHMLMMPNDADVRITLLDGILPTTPTSGTSSIHKAASSTKTVVRSQPLTLPIDVLMRRSELAQERSTFEDMIAKEWPREEFERYHRAKLDVELNFLRSQQSLSFGSPTSSSLQTASSPRNSSPASPPPDNVPVYESHPTTQSTPNPESPPLNETLVANVKTIMNQVFGKVKIAFSEEPKYETSTILQNMKKIIVECTLSLSGGDDESTAAVKKIMNKVFSSLKSEFEAMKSVIVSTTMELLTPPSTTQPPAPSFTQPAAVATPVPTSSTTTAPLQTKTSKWTVKEPPQLNTANRSLVKESPKDATQVPDTTPKNTLPTAVNDTFVSTVNSSSITSSAPAPQATVARSTIQAPDLTSAGNNSAFIEQLRSQTQDRIATAARSSDVDISDPAILNAYLRMRDDSDSLRWILLGYKSSPNALYLLDQGEGGFDEMKEAVPDKPVFAYLNYSFGDTNRSKFVFISYTPDTLNGITKSRVVRHRSGVESFLKYLHLTWHILDMDEFVEADLRKKLLSAGGANYSVQESNKGDFTSYKTNTKQFYARKDKETAIKPAVYHQGPLSMTPVDISGRPTVAAATEALANTSTFFKNKH